MSNFTKFSSVELPTIENPLYTLTDDLVYERYEEWSWILIIAPKGTTTNFASIPWLCTILWNRDDPRWIKSSIIHDYLWGNAKTLKDYQDSNNIFYEAMIVEWSPIWIAVCFYIALWISKYFYMLYFVLVRLFWWLFFIYK